MRVAVAWLSLVSVTRSSRMWLPGVSGAEGDQSMNFLWAVAEQRSRLACLIPIGP